MQSELTRRTLELKSGPVTAFTVIGVGLAVGVMMVPVVLGLPIEPFLLVALYVVLLGGAMMVARRSGPGGIRRLFSGLLHWRIGVANWAIVVAAIPVLTIGVAAATGSYTSPEQGWTAVVLEYLFTTFVFGALLANLWEETVFQGLIQRNLTRRFGLLRAAAITAMPFAIWHIPINLAGGGTLGEILTAVAVTSAATAVMRYVIGRTDRVTGGSLLAAGVLHASFNASGKLPVTDDWWTYGMALVVLAVAMLAVDVLRARATSVRLYELPPPAPTDVAISH